jgi:hypothetical protein
MGGLAPMPANFGNGWLDLTRERYLVVWPSQSAFVAVG